MEKEMMLTLKEIFDKSVNGVAAQGMLSKDRDGTCFYRSPGGLKCGVGQLIDDDKYNEGFENFGIRALGDAKSFETDRTQIKRELITDALTASGIDVEDTATRDLLTNLQACHDGAESLTEFRKLSAKIHF
jgi:hypothetical protein